MVGGQKHTHSAFPVSGRNGISSNLLILEQSLCSPALITLLSFTLHCHDGMNTQWNPARCWYNAISLLKLELNTLHSNPNFLLIQSSVRSQNPYANITSSFIIIKNLMNFRSQQIFSTNEADSNFRMMKIRILWAIQILRWLIQISGLSGYWIMWSTLYLKDKPTPKTLYCHTPCWCHTYNLFWGNNTMHTMLMAHKQYTHTQYWNDSLYTWTQDPATWIETMTTCHWQRSEPLMHCMLNWLYIMGKESAIEKSITLLGARILLLVKR
jgi:hypothetical protein